MSGTPDVSAEATSETFPDRLRKSWKITYPLIVASLSPVALALADSVILGRYSTGALATIGLVTPIFVFAMALIVPWGTATQILVAQWQGAGDDRRIGRILDTGLIFSTTVGLAAGGLLVALAPVLIEAVATGDAPGDSVAVLRILVLCLPFAAVTGHYRGVFNGLGRTGIAMRVAVLVNLLNIPFSYALVFGLDLGAIGSATGTLAATAVGMIYIAWLGRRELRDRFEFWQRANLDRPRQILAPLWRVGWPDTSFAVIAYGADLALVSIVAYLGEVSLASYRLLVVTITALWVVVFSTSNGLSIIVGQRLGVGDQAGVRAAQRASATLMGVLAVLVALPALAVPSLYFGLFTADSGVISEARSAVYVIAGLVPLMVVGMAMAGVLRGAGDTKSVMYAGMTGQLFVGVPTAWLCAVPAGLGLTGVYLGFLASWITRTTVTYLRYRTGRWKTLNGSLG